jgi:hypothetical protein
LAHDVLPHSCRNKVGFLADRFPIQEFLSS